MGRLSHARTLLTFVMVVAAPAIFAGGNGEEAASEAPVIRYLLAEKADAAVKDGWPVIRAIEDALGIDIQLEPTPSGGHSEKVNILIATMFLRCCSAF